MDNVKIICDSLKPETLHTALVEELKTKEIPDGSIDLKLEEEPAGTLALDPVTVSAIFTASGVIIAAIITGLFSIWQKKIEKKSKSGSAIIRVKTKSGNIFEIPNGISDDELKKIINIVEEQSTEQIALIADI